MSISDAITNRGVWAGLPEGLMRALARQVGARAAAVRIPLFVTADTKNWLVAHWPRTVRRGALAAIDPVRPFPPCWPGADHPLIIRVPVPHDDRLQAAESPSAAFTVCVRVAIPMPLDVALECIFYFDGDESAAPNNAVCAEAALQWLPQFRSSMREHAKLLTPREAECLRLAYQGLTAGEVGQRLNCSDRTVNFHYANVMNRLGVSTKLAAALLLSWLGLL